MLLDNFERGFKLKNALASTFEFFFLLLNAMDNISCTTNTIYLLNISDDVSIPCGIAMSNETTL